MSKQHACSLVIAAALFCITACSKQKPLGDFGPEIKPAVVVPQEKIENSHVMTVFIHGTTFVPHVLRKQRCFNEQVGALGLHPISLEEDVTELQGSHMPPEVMASLYHDVFKQTHLVARDTSFSYHTFGWHAQLSKRARWNSARQLHTALVEEHKKQQTLHPDKTIKMCIVSHSHGCNVALHLAETNERAESKLCIDDLVLLGCPVQRETRENVMHSTFKNIYHVYSRGDMTQTADMISSSTSRQCFSQVCKKQLPAHVYEIEIDAAGIRPNHNELWVLGRLPWPLYRQNFPLHPLPVAVFAPAIMSLCKQYVFEGNARRISINPGGDTYHISMNYEAGCDVALNFDCKRILG